MVVVGHPHHGSAEAAVEAAETPAPGTQGIDQGEAVVGARIQSHCVLADEGTAGEAQGTGLVHWSREVVQLA